MSWKITAKADNEAEILLYDVIGGYNEKSEYQGAENLINKIKALGDVKNITLRINSVGGDLVEALGMYNYLKACNAKVTAMIDGLAASAASIVAMAGDEIIMPRNALMMIHDPMSFVCGNAEDMQKEIDILKTFSASMASIYAAKTRLEAEKILAMMKEETWMDAPQAYDLGFCTKIDEPLEIAAMATSGGGLKLQGKSSVGASVPASSFAEKLPENFKLGLNIVAMDTEKVEGKKLEINNAADLEKFYPDFTAELKKSAFDSGVQAERVRLKELDSLSVQGCEKIIFNAKYEQPQEAGDIALEILKRAKALKALEMDAETINPALTPQKKIDANEQKENLINAIAKNINSMRGY